MWFISYLIRALFCNSSLLKFKGISSESTTPLMNLSHFGKILSVLLLIKIFFVYKATPDSVSLDISKRPKSVFVYNFVNY